LTGLRLATGGTMRLGATVLDRNTRWQALGRQLAHIPEDRGAVGSVGSLSIAENLILKRYYRPPISKGWSIDAQAERQNAVRLVAEYQVATPSVETPVRMLSGGNLQKVILARETSERPKLMIAVHPTRGLDIGATEAVHKLLVAQRNEGAAILLISEDLDELLALSDRLAVMYEGRIVGEMPAEGADIQAIGLLMAGTKGDA
jgi:general nucleoside transport system ATP-binding protein